jgi:YVTN family beta-propeller protein
MTPLRLFSATLATLATVLLPAAVHAAPAATSYVPGPRWTLDGAGKWDYADVDPVRARLYLTRGERVQVLDLKTGKPVGEIGATAGVHGVAFAQDLKRGYASNGRANSVTVFDLDTLKTIGEIKVAGVNPDAILYEPASHKLYTFNGKSGDVSVFDAASYKALATIKVGGKPEFAVSDGAGRLFFNDEDGAQIGVIDVATDEIETAEEVAAVIGEALKYIAKEKIVACTNCGMAPMRRETAAQKLNALAQGAALARQRFG